MRRTAFLLIAILAASGCVTFSPTREAEIRTQLRREFLIYRIGGGFFSLVDGIDWEKRKLIELPPLDLLYVLQRYPLERRRTFFVPVKYLRLPEEDERDPTSDHGRWRGTEDTRTGIRVYVLYVSKIEKRTNGTYEVHCVNYNGPLASGRGVYIATHTDDGWTFERTDGSVS